VEQMKKLVIEFIDSGYCRIVYRVEGTDFFYCLQDEGENYGGVILYKCTSDHEPMYQARLLSPTQIEIPKGDCFMSLVVSKFIEDHKELEGI
jgi:hypothetical protein